MCPSRILFDNCSVQWLYDIETGKYMGHAHVSKNDIKQTNKIERKKNIQILLYIPLQCIRNEYKLDNLLYISIFNSMQQLKCTKPI